MTSLAEALEERMSLLYDQKVAYEVAIKDIDSKLELLGELLSEEYGEVDTPTVVDEPVKPKKPRGRPKGTTKSKKKPPKKAKSIDDTLYKEAVKNLGANGTTPEEQERKVRAYSPQPRAEHRLGPGITAGAGKKAGGETRSDAVISMEDDLPEGGE